MTNNETAVMLLNELAQSIRGDWGSIDGRNIRDDIERLTSLIDTTEPIDLSWQRGMANMCQAGHGHWTDYCEDDCKPIL